MQFVKAADGEYWFVLHLTLHHCSLNFRFSSLLKCFLEQTDRGLFTRTCSCCYFCSDFIYYNLLIFIQSISYYLYTILFSNFMYFAYFRCNLFICTCCLIGLPSNTNKYNNTNQRRTSPFLQKSHKQYYWNQVVRFLVCQFFIQYFQRAELQIRYCVRSRRVTAHFSS